MELVMEGERKIKEIQDEFTRKYPFLKMEFFRNDLVRLDRYPADRMISGQKSLKDAWINRKQGSVLCVTDDMTVFELESQLMDLFGLAAQVFRKSGNIWLETIRTDSWTLRQQNNHGMEISCEVADIKIDSDLKRDSKY